MAGADLFLIGLILLLAGAFILVWLTLLWRSLARQRSAHDIEQQRLRALITRFGRAPMAQFLLQPGRAYWFSPHGSVVGYITYTHNVVGLGDPIGPAEDIAGAIVSFRDYCHANGWQPAFYQIRPENISHYQAAGFGTAPLVQEPLPLYAQLTLPAADKTREDAAPVYYIAFPSPESLPAIHQAVRRAQSKSSPWQRLWQNLVHRSQHPNPPNRSDLDAMDDEPHA